MSTGNPAGVALLRGRDPGPLVIQRTLLYQLPVARRVERHDDPVGTWRDDGTVPDVDGDRQPARSGDVSRRQRVRSPAAVLPRLQVGGAAERHHALDAVGVP